jgi:hypothetical protein
MCADVSEDSLSDEVADFTEQLCTYTFYRKFKSFC